ncbi:unnamed protein product [Lathyrus sativus]|nr:unnamed protein product [Lathyrus sativus]
MQVNAFRERRALALTLNDTKTAVNTIFPSQESLVTNLVLRRDQLEAFEIAKRSNTIAITDTGSGKTLIAIMLIKEIGQAVRSSGVKKIIVFLAPTVVLQYKNIKHNTNIQVEEYHGAKGVDTWKFESWQKEVRDNGAMVMTPQTLLDALRKAFPSIEMICLMVLDIGNCHHQISSFCELATCLGCIYIR